jgi:release factor glutamine methyltransferase
MVSNSLLCAMTITNIEKVFVEDLTGLYGPEESASIAWLVIGFVCKINRTQYLNNKNNDLRDEELSLFYTILTELRKGVPVQYVLGETEFYGSVFKVDRSVLIPRPETEELVDWVLKDLKPFPNNTSPFKILDVGTGSGCIAITLKRYLPQARVFGLDISAGALETARGNAELNQVEVTFLHGDILEPAISERFDIIVSNPPYVTMGEKHQMHSNVVDYEPHNALFVPDNDPLIYYSAIADFALNNLSPNGVLFLEINENLGPETVSLLRSRRFKDIELKKDLRDKDRMIKAHLFSSSI